MSACELAVSPRLGSLVDLVESPAGIGTELRLAPGSFVELGSDIRTTSPGAVVLANRSLIKLINRLVVQLDVPDEWTFSH